MAINITSGDRRVLYTGDGTTTVYPVSFQFYDNGDIKVAVDSVLKTLSNDYTVTGAGLQDGGTVTFETAPALDADIVIYGSSVISRTSQFPISGRFNTETLNNQLNRLTIFSQEILTKLRRSIRLSDTDPTTSLVVPDAATRANKFFACDASGQIIMAAGTSADLGPVSSFMATLLDDANAAAARATLGVSSGSAATDSAAGIIELATQAEGNAGSDTTRAITPAVLHGITPATVTMDTVNDKAWILDATDGKLKLALIPAGASGEINTISVAGTGASIYKTKTSADLVLRGLKLSISNTTSGTGNGVASVSLSGSWTGSGDDLTLSLVLTANLTTFTTPGTGGSGGDGS